MEIWVVVLEMSGSQKMKRSEMVEHIQEELKELIQSVSHSSEKAMQHQIRAKADSILAMLEGMGMLPPDNGSSIKADENLWDEELEQYRELT